MSTSLSPLSVVIPGFNRLEPLKYTLRSVTRAAAVLGLPVEILLVDDGSSPPLVEQLQGFDAGRSVTHLRQVNQGSIVARLTGLAAARGECVLFLDSDDLVHPDKFTRQLAAMQDTGADVSYADMATATLGENHDVAQYAPAETLGAANDPAQFYIRVQPAPHNPIYRRSYLQSALATPLVPARRTMDPSGDVWLYYNLVVSPAKIIKVNAPLSAPGPHEEDRYSRHWEKLAVAALQIMETFTQACPATPATAPARQAVGEAAFRSWRALPRDFHAGFARRMLHIWRQAPRGPLSQLGTASFARLARWLGPVTAARLLRLLRARSYAQVRTLSADAYQQLFAGWK